MKRRSRATATAFIVAAAVSTACSFNTAPKRAADGGAHPLGEGETLGRIEPLADGTTVASSVITLLNMACANGQLIVRTNLKTVTGKMDCAQEVPQATLERFYGQAVSISYVQGHLRVESVSAGTLDLPVQDATGTDVNATP